MISEQQYLEQLDQKIKLNNVQLQVVKHDGGPLLLLASPGSGKTTTIIARIGYLIEVKKLPAKQILAVSFSKASAMDLLKRYEQLFPGLMAPQFSTIHSLAYKMMRTYFKYRQHQYHIIEGGLNEEEEEEKHESAYRGLSKLKLIAQLYEQKAKERIKDEQLEELSTFFSLIKNRQLKEQEWSTLKCSVPHAVELYKQYEHEKQHKYAARLIDFDDMLTIALEVLEQDINILKLYQQQFQYVLTDESQDTSLVQHRIVELLVAEHRQLLVVADDDQAIYSWRGADVQYLLHFSRHYAEAETLLLQQNYRSTQTIVDAANTIIKQNKSRYIKHMMTENMQGEPITIKRFTNSYEEAKYIAEKIEGSNELQEVAVLYRNHMSSLSLINELDKRGIPFYMKDADDRFFRHWIIQDILNILRLSYSDKHFQIFEAVAMKLQLYISQKHIELLKRNFKGESIWECLEEHIKLEPYQKNQLATIKSILPLLKELPPRLAIVQIREELGYNKVIKQLSERLGFKNDYLVSILDSLEQIADGLATSVQFVEKLNHLEQVQKQARYKKKGQAVTLSTLHSAKGLEFNTVFMMDLNEGVIPSRQDTENQLMMEEAVRLFYVGMTRARSTLHLLSVEQWFGQSVNASRLVRQLMPAEERLTVKDQYKVVKDSVKRQSQATANTVKANARAATVSSKRPVQAVMGYPDGVTNPAQLNQASAVEHKQFGKGKLVSNDGSKLKVIFEQSGEKTLILSYVFEQRILRIIS